MYCLKCGQELVDGGTFCPACGAPQNTRAPQNSRAPQYTNPQPMYTSQILSKEDYLSLSQEYMRDKKALVRKLRIISLSGFIGGALGLLLIPILIIQTKNFGSALVGFLIMAAGMITAIVTELSFKKKVEELGNTYYQQYVRSNQRRY